MPGVLCALLHVWIMCVVTSIYVSAPGHIFVFGMPMSLRGDTRESVSCARVRVYVLRMSICA